MRDPYHKQEQSSRWIVPGICLFLVAIVWIAFGQTLQHQFVNYDDDAYVLERPEINSGVTLHGIGWAFTHTHSGNWHPLAADLQRNINTYRKNIPLRDPSLMNGDSMP